MPQLINILPDHVINKIAAGEVVERPSSVIKELVENAVDAGADDIRIDIEQAGRKLLRVSDNGCGMSRDDARTAFLRHATSKITSDADLDAIRTMGFRGEALSSIASVSQVRMITVPAGASAGTEIVIEAGRVTTVADSGGPQGTSIEVANLFYNTPARLKRKDAAGRIGRLEVAGKVINAHAVNAGRAFVLADLLECALQVGPFQHPCQQRFRLN